MDTRVHFSSATDLHATPQHVFDQLHAEFSFNTDVCATPENAKCAHYFTPQMDGLKQCWIGNCWMNPPYGRTIGQWIKKAHQESTGGGLDSWPTTSTYRHRLLA